MDYYGLLLFFVLEYVRPASYIPFLYVLHLNVIVPISVFLISLGNKSHITNTDVFNTFNFRIVLFFLFLILISIFTAEVTLYAYTLFINTLGYVLVVFMMIKILSDVERIKGVFFILILSHVLIIALNPEIITDPTTRHYLATGSFLGDGNDFALSLNIILPFSIYLFLTVKSFFKRYFYAAFSILLVLSIIGTSSRGGTLTLIALLLYFWWKSSRKMLGAIAVTILAVTVLAFAPQNYFERMETISEYHQDGSAMGRIMAWKAATKMGMDHPFLGVGAGHFSVKFGLEYRPEGFGRTELPWLTAHSQYFLALGELGIPGLIFIVAFFFFNLKRNNQLIKVLNKNFKNEYPNYHKLLLCLNTSLIAYAVGGAFLSTLYYPHLFVLAGLHESTRIIINKELREGLS